jgi:Tfp pilus assembly protein PilF
LSYLDAIRLDPAQALPWANYGDYLVDMEKPLEARRIFEIGAQLPGGEYSLTQVQSIDEDLQFDKEQAQEEQQEKAAGEGGSQ